MKLSWFIPNYLISRVARKILPVRRSEFVQSANDYFVYDSTVYDKQDSCYYEGYWQAVDYYAIIRNKLCDIFQHPSPNETNKLRIEEMESSNSVGIHIRRGDYLLSDDFRGICEVDYYKSAIDKILQDGEKHLFYVFSNDQEWCEEYIRPLLGNSQMIFVTGNTGHDSCWDMFLMTHCKDLIIANSSFSWWGAFLNKRGGRIIAPRKWKNKMANMNYGCLIGSEYKNCIFNRNLLKSNSVMNKVALITGITGQDGSFLAEFLLDKGYDVHGTIRRSSVDYRERIAHLEGLLHFIYIMRI